MYIQLLKPLYSQVLPLQQYVEVREHALLCPVNCACLCVCVCVCVCECVYCTCVCVCVTTVIDSKSDLEMYSAGIYSSIK